MAKAVVYTLLFAVFVVFVIFSPMKQRPSQSIEGLISRRLGHKFHPPAFDPLVTRIERMSWEKEASPSNGTIHVDAAARVSAEEDMFEEYFAEEGKVNTTMRIKFLFPLLDAAPRDGFVSLKELQTWMMQQTEDNMGYRTAKELDLRDKDRDGSISFEEYLPQFSKEDIERNEKGHGEAGWWKDQFKNADFDHNGSLDIEEFNNFLHPEDSRNGDIQRWVLKERITGMDKSGDGKLDYKEFLESAYEMYREFAKFETETEDDHVPTAQLLFAELDKDKDRFLVADELRPIVRYLQPGEMSYAKYYSSFLFHEADDDKDGKLSLDEMLNHEDVFYKAVHQDDDDDDDEEDDDHDEL
ncbi:PREDICTED: calumenin-A [Tarenaya hassleriana]|uniref:calumenin-A n=1 Tax=Tarenaya hassleriana TaxID=28532 RepID=UPI00053C86FF|nr:PREDICTED: calumenin-A [Tarenaya hassleriana]